MKKSVISFVLVLAIVLSLGTTVFAADWESEIDTVGVAVVNGKYYDTLQEAVSNANGAVVTLLQDSTEAATAEGELNLDLNGRTASGVTATKIFAYDTSATTTAAGKGKLVTDSAVEVFTAANDTRYAALKDGEGAYTIHAFDLSMTNVNLRTEEAGINYTAILTCDETLRAAITSHGVVLSLQDVPGADFKDVSTDAYTVYAGAPAATAEFNSGYVRKIFKDTLRDAANTKRGEYTIYANAYLCIGEDIAMADVANVGQKPTENTYSLKDVMVTLNKDLDSYASQLDQIVGFYKKWAEAMANWNLDKIAAKA